MQILPPVTIIGNNHQGGTYIQKIMVEKPLQIQIGKFMGGKQIKFAAGQYLYVGSALATTGATSLAHRILRHLTRSDGKPPHKIRDHTISAFSAHAIGSVDLIPPAKKTLFWNIDYLLEQKHVSLSNLLIIRSPKRIEGIITKLLEEDPHTSVIEKGLGANDLPGRTNLLCIAADEQWWITLITRLESLI